MRNITLLEFIQKIRKEKPTDKTYWWAYKNIDMIDIVEMSEAERGVIEIEEDVNLPFAEVLIKELEKER